MTTTESPTVTITADQFDAAWTKAIDEAKGKDFLLRLLLMVELGLLGKKTNPS